MQPAERLMIVRSSRAVTAGRRGPAVETAAHTSPPPAAPRSRRIVMAKREMTEIELAMFIIRETYWLRLQEDAQRIAAALRAYAARGK